MTEKIPEDCQK